MTDSYNWLGDNNNHQEQLVANTYNALERTSASIQRSQRAAIESEQTGTEVLSELSEQREALLRSSNRLENADRDLLKSHAVIRSIRREVIYNKLILSFIILLEICILLGMLAIKFTKFK